MSGINKQILVGRVGKEPEVKSFDGGKVKATFSIATSETFKDRTTGTKKEATEWHQIVVWGKLADVVKKYVKKGDMLYLEGKTIHRSFETDKGEKRYITEVVVSEITFLTQADGNRSAKNEDSFAEAAQLVS